MKKIVMILTVLAAPMFALSEVHDVEMSYHSDYDYYSMKISGHFEANFQVFLDTDNNKRTGYTRKKENPKAIGADYLIEGSNLFKYEGRNGSGNWEGWRYLYDLNSFGNPYVWISNSEIVIDLSKEFFNIGNRFNYGVRALNSNWGVDDSYPKKGNRLMLRYTKPYQGCASGDRGFIYKNLEEITFAESSERKNISVTRNRDNTLLINTNGSGIFHNSPRSSRVKVSHTIALKSGGFDVKYSIRNLSNSTKALPVLKIPGINFGDTDVLKILNPLFKHYLQERDITTEQNYLKEGGGKAHVDGSNYFAVANAVRTVKINDTNTKYELHFPYGKDDKDGNEQFVYSPVIVATNDNFAVGSSLNLNSKHKRERLHVKMSIAKEQNARWSYLYDLSDNNIAAKGKLNLTVSVRFADKDKWIFTLYPYKELLNSSLDGEKNIPTKKDLRPIQTVSFAVRDGIESDKSRAWSMEFTGQWSQEHTAKFPLRKSLEKVGEELSLNGYSRSAIWNFTGLYENNRETKYGDMSEQLPFQFVSSTKGQHKVFPKYMENNMTDIIDNGLTEYAGIEMGYDWGISGNIPVGKNNKPLKTSAWQPYDIVPFNYCDESHRNYAQYYLNEAKKLQGIFEPKFIRLDAFIRMDLDGRVKWLKHLQKSLPNTTFALESSIDYMHARSASILQLDSTQVWVNGSGRIGSKEEHTLTQPDLLAHYLNPGAETIVAIEQSIFGYRKDLDDRKKYLQELVTLGYTPLISFWGFNYIVNIKEDIDTSVNQCFDGKDNNGDGNIDWPYDENCRIEDMNADAMRLLKER